MVFEAIEKRRSIRRFKDTEITEREIKTLLEAVRLERSAMAIHHYQEQAAGESAARGMS